MAEERANYSSKAEAERPAHSPDYHVMVLLVDDQAMVCEAVRRALANQPDIDFHYCADAREAITIGAPVSSRAINLSSSPTGIEKSTSQKIKWSPIGSVPS